VVIGNQLLPIHDYLEVEMPAKSTYWTTKRKRDVARRMIESGHKNDEIKEHLKKKSGSGISSENLAELRAQNGTSGPNRKKKTNGKVKKKNGKITKEDVMILQGDDFRPEFKSLLARVKNEMVAQGIRKLEITHTGHVHATQLQDVITSV
jgi:hypothetical protein